MGPVELVQWNLYSAVWERRFRLKDLVLGLLPVLVDGIAVEFEPRSKFCKSILGTVAPTLRRVRWTQEARPRRVCIVFLRRLLGRGEMAVVLFDCQHLAW